MKAGSTPKELPVATPHQKITTLTNVDMPWTCTMAQTGHPRQREWELGSLCTCLGRRGWLVGYLYFICEQASILDEHQAHAERVSL